VADLKVQVRGAAGAADAAYLLAADDAVADPKGEAGRIDVPVKGIDRAAIGKGMADDQGALVGAPSQRGGVGHLTVTDGIERFAKASTPTPADAPPVLTGVVSLVAGTVDAKVSPADGDAVGVGRVHGKVEGVDDSTRGAGHRYRVAEEGAPQVATDARR
jgi:hypothetical protein